MATGHQQGRDSGHCRSGAGANGGRSRSPEASGAPRSAGAVATAETRRRRSNASLAAGSALGLVVAVALAASPTAQAGPQGGQVVAGSATITQTAPNRLDVLQSSHRAIVDWRSFSIGADEHAHFQQPSSAAATLNRVKGGDPSRILGQLSANGQVMLVNPNGVFFGPGSRVDVGALMASTADIANDDFLAGRYRFTTPSPNPDAGIVNLGEIRAADGGFVVLAAPHVRNEGSIQARLGQVVLAGAPTFTVDFDGDGLLQFDLGGPVTAVPRGADGQPVGALVTHAGTVQADGGRVTLTARAADQVIDRVIHMGGVVQAQTVESRGGEIILRGGDVGTVAVTGTLDASGPAAGQRGGTVKVLGEKVGLFDGARVDASGGAGGGKVLIGGNFRGQGPEPNARRTYLAPGARLAASALDRGDGGQVIVWADEAAAVYGQVSAAGGPAGGNGGLIELSGKQYLAFGADVDLDAPRGQAGTLLLDPLSIRIVAGENAEDDGEISDGVVLESERTGEALTLSETALEVLGAGLNVVLEATETITVEDLDDDVLRFAASMGSVTFRAGGAFQVEGSLTVETQGGDLAIEAAEVTPAPDSGGSLALRTSGGNLSVQARTGFIDIGNVDSSSKAGPSGAVTLSAAGSVAVGGVDARGVGGGDVTLTALNLLLTDAEGIAGSGALRLQPPNPDDAIAIGTAPDGFEGLLLAQGLLDRISPTFASLTIGREDGRHAISIVDVTFPLPVTIQTPEGGQTAVDATEGTTGLFGYGSVTILGSGATTFLNADIRTAGQPIVIRDNVVLGGPVTLSTVWNGGGAGISLLGSVDGTFPLILQTGTGDLTFGGTVGGSAPPSSISVASARNVRIGSRFATGEASFDYTGDATSTRDALDVGTLFLNPAAASANLFGRVRGRTGWGAAEAVDGPRGDPDFRVNGYVIGSPPPELSVVTPSVFPFGTALLAEPQATGGQPLRLPTPFLWVVARPQFLAGDPTQAQFSNFGNEELWGVTPRPEAEVR